MLVLIPDIHGHASFASASYIKRLFFPRSKAQVDCFVLVFFLLHDTSSSTEFLVGISDLSFFLGSCSSSVQKMPKLTSPFLYSQPSFSNLFRLILSWKGQANILVPFKNGRKPFLQAVKGKVPPSPNFKEASFMAFPWGVMLSEHNLL